MQKIEDISNVSKIPVQKTTQGVRYIQVGKVRYYRKYDIMQGESAYYKYRQHAKVYVITNNKNSMHYIAENPMMIQRWHTGIYISAKWLYNYIYWRQLKYGGRGAWDTEAAEFIAEELNLKVITRDKSKQRAAMAEGFSEYIKSEKSIQLRLEKMKARHARLKEELATLEAKINKLKK